MTVADYVLDGLAEALELERELGVRVVEIDRALLATDAKNGPATAPVVRPKAQIPNSQFPISDSSLAVSGSQSAVSGSQSAVLRSKSAGVASKAVGEPSLVFIHDRPLSPGGIGMMAKIVAALGLTDGQAPIIVEPPIPNAKMFVFLGFRALRRYMPAMRIEENTWGKSPKGKDILVVKSPEEILRFGTVTPAVEKMKKDMWRSLKAVKQRLALS